MKLAIPFGVMAALSAAPPAFAQQQMGAPSAAAMTLARSLREPLTPAQLVTVANNLRDQLLQGQAAWRGLHCDADLPACRSAAERIARESASQFVEDQQRIDDVLRAALFDLFMKPAEIVKAQAFVATPAGAAFVRVLTGGWLKTVTPEQRQRIDAAMRSAPKPTGIGGLFDRFYDETASLPRSKPMLAPPAPPAPPSPPKPTSKL